MTISRDEEEIVFQSKCGDPKIVVRDRRSGSLKLNEETCVVFGCFPAWQQHTDSRFREQSAQQNLVSPLLRPTMKAGFYFAENHERNPDLLGCP